MLPLLIKTLVFGGAATIATAVIVEELNNYTPQSYKSARSENQILPPTLVSKPASSRTSTKVVKIGPRGEQLIKKTENFRTIYVKKNLSLEAIANYKWAMDVRVGPPVEINKSERSVTIVEGINPLVAVKRGMITKQEAISQVENLQAILRNNERAHCDVKLDNCLYFVELEKIYLIDNGEIKEYGQNRVIWTKGENTTEYLGPGQEEGVAGPFTDSKGFKNIINSLKGA